ncbi:McrB family protein [Aestuariivirga sp.]|uniref:McrB family protein n=1 Tax=Aestuariivirga sp. TaxID=2650926 RepID=UPI00391AA7A0
MATYLSAQRIARAIEQLGESRAKRTPIFDFLIVKRTLAIKGASSTAIAESESTFLQSLEELGATGLGDTDHYYINPFALREAGKSGFRPARYRSNGTNSTISGTIWQGVISLTSDKPRKASLASGYESHLEKLTLTKDEAKQKPNLTETAVWYWRGKDVETLLAGASNDAERLQKLTDEFVGRVGLTPAEIGVLFDSTVDASPTADGGPFVSTAPVPQDYLPTKTLPAGITKAENPSEVSFSLVSALAAKNFVILTGPSGTGKSRAALKLAEGLQRNYAGEVEGSIFELVAVGPDWTSPKRLLGFRTPFGKERKLPSGGTTHESYEITETIRLILRASHSDAAAIPHFLIFDEMNLSHVERYFAPFLSLMEAANILDAEAGLSLIGSDELQVIADVLEEDSPGSREAEAAKAILAEGRDLILPPNLYFIGTVNVDETTYMFSPKVLDRAHVIELDAERPSQYLLATTRTEPGGTITVSQADVVLRKSIEARESQKYAMGNPAAILDSLIDSGLAASDIGPIREATVKALDGTYDLLAPVGFAFGYRISKEVFVYIVEWTSAKVASGVDKSSILAGWPEALDHALLQKVLPKIHGNRRTLNDSLRALSAFYAGNDVSSTPSASYTLGLGTLVEIPAARKLTISGAADPLPLSRRKLNAMHDRLNATGYVSFVS